MSDLIIQAGEVADSPIAVFIMGATATGKTDLALALYDELGEQAGADLISGDFTLVV